jgi:hypothetical protein
MGEALEQFPIPEIKGLEYEPGRPVDHISSYHTPIII